MCVTQEYKECGGSRNGRWDVKEPNKAEGPRATEAKAGRVMRRACAEVQRAWVSAQPKTSQLRAVQCIPAHVAPSIPGWCVTTQHQPARALT